MNNVAYTITVEDEVGSKVIRVILPNEDKVFTWIDLTEQWFDMLRGLGYDYKCTPYELAEAVEQFYDNYKETKDE